MVVPIFRPHYLILEMLQRPRLLPSSFSAFRPPPPLLHHHVIHPLSTTEVGVCECKEEVGKNGMVGKKWGRITKERSKKVRKTDIIEIGKSDEQVMGRVKWKDFEVHQLIAIRGEIEKEFVKSANKQGKFSEKYNFFEQKLKP